MCSTWICRSGGERNAVPLHLHDGLETGLVLELAQRRLQRRFDVLGVRPRPEVHQQLAHVAVALAHARVDLGQRLLDLLRVAAADGIAHQLDLDPEKGQRLRDRVVQLASQEGALLRHRRLLLERVQAQVLHRPGQVRDQRLEQRALGRRQRQLRMKEQVDFAHHPLVQPDRHATPASRSPALAQCTRPLP